MAFGGLLGGHIDPLSFFLPTDCFLGQSLASGDLPAWNPHVMLGAPFAADPQSGWMSILPMSLFSTLSCSAAIRWLIVLLPIVGGIGMYAFLRSEGLARVAAAVGGASMALGIAGSRLALSLPFSGALAWTAVALWGASRTLRAASWPSRLVWSVVTAVAWGQILGAHLSHGTVIGTAALVVFVIGRTLHDVRGARTTTPGRAIAVLLVLGAVLLAVNLAFLLPRVGAYPRTTLSIGYEELNRIGGPGSDQGSEGPDKGLDSTWIFKLGSSPGLYVGGGILLLSFGGAFSRRLRYLFWTMGAFALASYLVSLTAVFRFIMPVVSRIPFADQVLLHRPWRYSLALVVALPILGAIGLQAWIEAERRDVRIAIVAVGAAVWFALPLGLGIDEARLLLGGVTAVVIVGLLLLVMWRPAIGPGIGVAILLVVVGELVANAEIGRDATSVPREDRKELAVGPMHSSWIPTTLPYIDVERFVDGSAFQHPIRATGDRFTTLGRYHGTLSPEWDPTLGDQRAMILGLEDVSGYNPVQLFRYWRFIREVNRVSAGPRKMKYNRTQLVKPSEETLDLLDVGWMVRMEGQHVPRAWTLVARDGRYGLYRRPTPPRASVFGGWTVARRPNEALDTVVEPGFDPRTDLVIEGDPGIESGSTPDAGVARFRWLSSSTASIEVVADRPGIVLIRHAFDPRWRATVDGEPETVLPADYVLQGVPVPAGRHVVHLAYDDPWIRWGLIGSAAAIVLVLALAFALDRRSRTSARGGPPRHALEETDADGADRPEAPVPVSHPAQGPDA